MAPGTPRPSREGLKTRLLKEGFALPLLFRSGLVAERDRGTAVDRFRNRLMIPICRDNGAIVAFGGRAMDAGQQPKYLNSPETPIYVKGRTLYGLHLSKGSVIRAKHAVMVEGYFDFAQAYQAGITNVVASSGTALTPVQAKLLKRFATKVVLNFDPDAAGQGAAARSSELLVAEGFQVNVAMLPPGDDPDTFIRKSGGAAYQDTLRNSRPYLEYLLDRASAAHDLSKDDSRREFLNAMLTVAAKIPDAAARDQFADRLAHKARITEEVVRAEIRKAAVQRQPTVQERTIPAASQVKPAERGLIWAIMRQPEHAAAGARGPGRRRARGSGDGGHSSAGAIPARMSGSGLTSDAFAASKSRGGPSWSNRSPSSRRRRPESCPIACWSSENTVSFASVRSLSGNWPI